MGFNIVAYQNKVNIVTQLPKSYNDIFGVYHTFMYAFTYICKGCATKPPKPTQPNLTCWFRLVFRDWWVELDYEIFFKVGWVRVITITNPPNPTRPDPCIYLNFKLYIFKNILYN